ncbi:metal-dependent transcriptional regulator [Vagococcus intermedius]|uniref:Manganese transport regulator n=1 Tax=Vagococcus intermedius TaxID=2991418 RepID=A0AAF0CWV7_9ENTE|nr:metal-dependent transcriptional regulator [Vagococcus intermedius]WEG74301.1 metal-dependent transcriptional regulator [Vagococcus intermedius]WEG76382.1 metal-dependent transcriptional regulator [Vagococcus intermedius]
MTPNKEDYLKLIFELGGYEKKITNKSIVAGLNVSAASVSEMISKLEKQDFVKHSPYQGVQLTDLGLQHASSLVRKHRLWEVFLVEHLNYSWNEVHEEAEVLEHVTSSELASRLESYLDFPKACPHGGVIPGDNQPIQEHKFSSLNDFKEQDKVIIKRVIDETELLDYLASIGLNINDTVTIKTVGAYEGPLTLVNNHGKKLHVSYKAAHNIFVAPL